MAVKTAYVSKLGADYKISPHFTLGEMQCHDGTDKVLYSTELVDMLEKLRSYGGFTITIISWYRTQYHNDHMRPPGAKHSQHIQGTAADVHVKKDGKPVSGKLICCLAQTLGFKGIGYMSETSVHLDMRSSGTYRGNENKNGKRDYGNNVGGDFYRYFGVNMSQIAALKASTETNNITENTAKEEEKEMVYKDINDIPDWGREAVQRRIDGGYTDGKNLTESMVRCWVVEDRMNPFYSRMEDVPEYWFDAVKEMVAAGVIMGDGANQIGMTHSELKIAVVAWRIKKLV